MTPLIQLLVPPVQLHKPRFMPNHAAACATTNADTAAHAAAHAYTNADADYP